MSVKGSCLCGGIRYEVDGLFGRVVNCHCSMCRKATGAAFRTRAAVPASALRWIAGGDLISRYESSPGEIRTFCRVCGATLATIFRDRPEEIGLPLGTLDDDPGVRPSAHVFVDSKAAWFEIADALPRYSGPLVGDAELSNPPLAAERRRHPHEVGLMQERRGCARTLTLTHE
jgi:hypothetical protein